MTDSGPLLFARFAYPPNELGYCGPDDSAGLLDHVAAPGSGADREFDGALRAAAPRFEGAWPYLRLIATANGIADPLDRRVVEAYWIGNRLLDDVDARTLGDSMEERFRPRAGRSFDGLVAPVLAGARPHHNFHVFAVYPWLGLIRSGVVDAPLGVLDRCRVRWGRVEALVGDRAVVSGQPLQWDGRRLVLGAERSEDVLVGSAERRLADRIRVGDWCALHWGWVCTALTPAQVTELRRWTRRTMTTVNAMPAPAPATVLA